MSRRTLLVGVVLPVVLLASCSGGASDGAGDPAPTVAGATENTAPIGEPQAGGTLHFGLVAETTGWNPYEGQWAASAYIVANAIFDPLVAYDDEGLARPYLAESLTPNQDFTEWEIALRPDVAFHNGEPLDAEAVVTNLETGRTSGLTALSFDTVTSIEAVDDLTVRVTMSEPFSTFPLLLAGQAGYMAAPAQLADEEHSLDEPIGTGPFRLVEWIPDDHLEVARNDDYWQDGLPYLDGIDFRVLPDSTSRDSAFETGEIDAMEISVSSLLRDVQERADAGDVQLYTDAGRQTDESIIAFNTAEPPFDDPLARQLVATAIDRETLSEASSGGINQPAWGPYTEDSPAYLSPEESGIPPFDPAEAQVLADRYEAEHGEPLRFALLLPPDPSIVDSAQLVQQQLAVVGIEMEIESVEQSELINSVLTGGHEAAFFVLFSTPTLDRGYQFIASEPPPAGLTLNVSRFFDPDLTAAMDAARATDDPAAQAEQYQEVQRRFGADLQILFLARRLRGVAYDNETFGFRDATFPGTDDPANAGFFTTPFTTSVWQAP